MSTIHADADPYSFYAQMKSNSVIDPRTDLPASFTLPLTSLASEELIRDEAEKAVGITPSDVHYFDAPLVSFGEGRTSGRWWYRGDPETGIFERISPPHIDKNEHRWKVSPPETYARQIGRRWVNNRLVSTDGSSDPALK